MLYGAIALTLFTAYKLSQSWGSTAGIAFAILNAVIIFLFPAGKMIGLILAGTLWYLLGKGGSDNDSSTEPPAA
ncbi:MAG: hypothetical protein K0V04_32850 [Deltaproteobacteria bacterium]|nr:hypothetical protein [Deltaproteobacteria bacterium]